MIQSYGKIGAKNVSKDNESEQNSRKYFYANTVLQKDMIDKKLNKNDHTHKTFSLT